MKGVSHSYKEITSGQYVVNEVDSHIHKISNKRTPTDKNYTGEFLEPNIYFYIIVQFVL